MASTYSPPLALTIISSIFLVLGALCFLVIVGDILWRRGWRSMMWIMIVSCSLYSLKRKSVNVVQPVYPINAAYMLPLTLFVYFKYGRPTRPNSNTDDPKPPCHTAQDTGPDQEIGNPRHDQHAKNAGRCKGDHGDHSQPQARSDARHQPQLNSSDSYLEKAQHNATDPHAHRGREDTGDSRPMWATVLIGVSHCGAGCVLGDIVGEWIVYGTGATINGHSIWVNLLVDYGFALLFGIAFQYFSIAPMSGEYGPKSLWRAAKADILSLTSFEIGAFG